MARIRKKRYQLLRNIVLGALIFIMIAMLLGGIAQAVIVFLLTGIISGTTIVVPVWGMAVIYLSIVSFASLSYFIDRELESQYLRKLSGKTETPRRRFGL